MALRPCGESIIGNQEVRKLLVQNEQLTGRKIETVKSLVPVYKDNPDGPKAMW